MDTNDTTPNDTPACPWCGHPCQTAWDDFERCEAIDCPHCGYRLLSAETGGPAFPDDEAA
jgi:DNA-directed RNA polymerase subunit RPC12/RpoP